MRAKRNQRWRSWEDGWFLGDLEWTKRFVSVCVPLEAIDMVILRRISPSRTDWSGRRSKHGEVTWKFDSMQRAIDSHGARRPGDSGGRTGRTVRKNGSEQSATSETEEAFLKKGKKAMRSSKPFRVPRTESRARKKEIS